MIGIPDTHNGICYYGVQQLPLWGLAAGALLDFLLRLSVSASRKQRLFRLYERWSQVELDMATVRCNF